MKIRTFHSKTENRAKQAPKKLSSLSLVELAGFVLVALRYLFRYNCFYLIRGSDTRCGGQNHRRRCYRNANISLQRPKLVAPLITRTDATCVFLTWPHRRE
jgi:hypothetical protein